MAAASLTEESNMSSHTTQTISPVSVCSAGRNESVDIIPIPKSDLYGIRSTPGAGRGVFATKAIEAGTLLFSTSRSSKIDNESGDQSRPKFIGIDMSNAELLSPTAYTILRPYRLEVCAECFAYDRGRRWKVKINEKQSDQIGQRSASCDTGFVFCTERCRNRWLSRYGDLGVRGFAAVEEVIKKLSARKKMNPRLERQLVDTTERSKTQSLSSLSPRSHTNFGEIKRQWMDAQQTAQQITHARQTQTWTKSVKKLMREASEPEDIDADILYYLLTGILNAHLAICDSEPSEQFASTEELPLPHSNVSLRYIVSLAPDDQCYEHPASTLSAYIQSYLILISILPSDLMKITTPILCHELCSRASHNAFSIRPAGGTDGEQSGEFLGWGVWPEASFFNHSCSCNVKKERKGRHWEFRTGELVMEGEQLCITYLGGDEKDFDTQKRRETLKDGWGFNCACSRCATDD